MSAADVFRYQRAVTRAEAVAGSSQIGPAVSRGYERDPATTRAEAARERLSGRYLPGGERSWIDLAVDAARAAGCSVDDILGDDRHATIVRWRHAWWAALRREGYSYPEIAAGAGVDVSTVIAALKKLSARGSRGRAPVGGFAGMGPGAGI